MTLHILRVIACLAVLTGSGSSVMHAQEMGPSQSAPTSDSVVAELATEVKLVGGILTGIGTLLGLPLVLFRYRKTRAEIVKLDLDAAVLRAKLAGQSASPSEAGSTVTVHIEHSPSATVNVTADPRFLAPLLLLVDFIYAWVLLTAADYFIRVFIPYPIDAVVLGLLAAAVLLPIAGQVLRVRRVLRPLQSHDEIEASVRNGKTIVYGAYGIIVVLTLVAAAILASAPRLTDLGIGAAWGTGALGVLLLAAVPYLKPRVDRRIERLLR